MVVKGVRIFITGLLISILFQASARDYLFEPITSNAGITFNAINTVIDDKYGFIWFGCNNGLYFYNSSEIKKINFDSTKPDAPSSKIIRYLYRDRTERIWVCTNNGINYFDEESNSFRQINFANSSVSIGTNTTLLCQVSTDNYLAIIGAELYQFNLEDLELIRVEVGQGNVGISYFTADALGNLYISANNGSIYKTDSLLNDVKEIYRGSNGPIETLSTIKNQLWIGYRDNGIDIIDSNGDLKGVMREELTGSQKIINNHVRRIVERSNKEVWIGSQGGITVIGDDGNHEIIPTFQNGLPHEGIFDLFVDRNDGVWVSTWSGGLAYHHSLNYKFPQIQSIFLDKADWNSVISSFSEDVEGAVWVGSENHGLYKYYPNTNSYNKKLDSPIRRIKAMAADKKNRIWIGTLFEGLWLYQDEEFKQIGDINAIISSVLPTRAGV